MGGMCEPLAEGRGFNTGVIIGIFNFCWKIISIKDKEEEKEVKEDS